MPFALRCLLACTAIAILLSAAGAAHGAPAKIRIETRETKTANGKPAAELLVNGEVVASLAKDEGGRSPVRSISTAATILAGAYRSGKFEIKTQATDDTNRRWVLFVNGRALLVASDAEAKAWGVEPKALAQTWQRKLNEALAASPPPLADPGKPQASPAPPQASGKPATSQAGPPVVQRQPDAQPSGKTVQQSTGRTADPPAATRLDRVPELPAGAIVTGSKPPVDIVNSAIDAALRFEQRIPGAQALLWRYGGSNPRPLALSPGQSGQVPLEYSSGGQDRQTSLGVYNRALALPRESLTLFSNSPESVYGPQLLYEAELPGGTAGRLVYHHQNQSRATLRCVVRVFSLSDPGALHVVPGTAKSDINTFFVGFKSAENYWANVNAGNGFAAPIAAGGQLVLLNQEIAYGFTSSGYMKLTNLGAQPLRIEVLALPAGDRLPDGPIRPAASTSHCVFGSPYFAEDARYSAGDQWLYLRLGAGRPESTTDDSVLHGCYGMTHSYNIELHNSGDFPALIFIVLRASAGEVKGQFYINDEYVATPLVTGGEELLLREVPLPPGSTRQLKIRALALNGGFYPASIILRETRYP